jgi:hypothetical protein
MEISMRKLFLTAVVLPLFVAPASAGTFREPTVIAKAQSRQSVPVGWVAARARNAYGMQTAAPGFDPYSPAATGGGSLGYNRNLLEY